ncbi:hypothetical protein RHSIM_Rhsim04G0014900 [Rhododendron simsii]|uniref:Uncharacterized protein n=1 Tax=Rhododendron simsii TaxID=118357 RepID=A0A834H0Y0_RHOSS|nr:hypothetical protein RHSIM_Rhsim04G0014900 [Rhododendron simsii]
MSMRLFAFASLICRIVEREREREMHSLWVSWKERANCRSKLIGVCRPEKLSKERRCIFEKEKSDGEIVHPMEGEREYEAIFRQKHPQNSYHELDTSDPSRKIIEMIFQGASTHPSKQYRKTKKVLRVNNSAEMVERFERYREMVKKRACEQHKMHLRSTVDGNELLQFYGTTMNCFSGKKPSMVPNACCKDLTCRVCRIIQSGFNTAYTRKNGIQFSTSSEELSEDMIKIIKGKNVKRAVIVCRTIAGTVANVVDERSHHEEYDSIKLQGLQFKSDHLIVQNPSAVLPCFVVIFN